MIEPRHHRRFGGPSSGVDPPTLRTQLALDYPDLSVRVLDEALQQADVAARRLGAFADDIDGGLASLARDHLDLVRRRGIDAADRVAHPHAPASIALRSDCAGERLPRPGDNIGARRGGAMAATSGFNRLVDLVLAHGDAPGAPMTLLSVCRAALDHLDLAGVAVSVPDALTRVHTISAHGARARELEELQVTVGEGPSLDVLRSGASVLIDDLDGPDAALRWPIFARVARDAGAVSVSAFPMRVGAARFGALVCYADRAGALSAADAGDARAFASIALDLLLEHVGVLIPDGAGESSSDRRFLDDRPEIHQATGMVSVQLGVDMGTALLRIRGRAFADGRLLSELAADVVSRTIRFTDEERERE